MKPRFNTRKSAGLIATAGLSLMLVGAGLSATFTDSGVVSQSVAVGTFQIELSTADTNATISGDKKSITFTAPAILSSAPGSAPIYFSVKNIGSIPVTLSVVGVVTGPAKFTAIGGAPADVTLAQNAVADYAGGIQWTELVNDDLNRTISVTYTISAVG